MVEGKVKHGKPILDRFKLVIDLNPGNAESYFDYAKYMEYLYDDAKGKESKDIPTSSASGSVGDVAGLGVNTGSSGAYKHDISSQYAVAAIDMYGKCLQYSANVMTPTTNSDINSDTTSRNYQNNNISLQALPRFLTLWLTFTTPTEDNIGKIKPPYADTPQIRWMDKMNQRIIKCKSAIPVPIWYKGK